MGILRFLSSKPLNSLIHFQKHESKFLVLSIQTICGLFQIVIDAKDFLRTGSGNDIKISENTSDEDGDVLGLLIVEHNQNSKEKISSTLLDSNYGVDGNLKVWSELSDSSETDSSGDTNSDEYPDSESYDTDSESNYYHPEDYEENMSTEVATLSESQPAILRKAWKSCLKKAAKVCKKACVATYKNACDGSSCKSKFKKSMKKGCKRYCKDSFV
ncbi:uncharacterized protein LOC113505055 [Trichoplusia ni]|uniref:Uncharacterized protein LOC113505055 n=1 Tax=Trichoplusia ni TaxID=7111 RepID=A0A7E5WRG8_TRINI|nr:uncharacterized protein LOC113505055 [Trichoplusia ni]